MEIARRNAAQAGVTVDFRLGNASELPLEANLFDLTFCQAALKNFADPVMAIAEMHRVLRPYGAAAIFDMRRGASSDVIQLEVEKWGLGRWIG